MSVLGILIPRLFWLCPKDCSRLEDRRAAGPLLAALRRFRPYSGSDLIKL
jgi:hypothetical protein